ncbi:MAG: tyrosine-type recombinase/integrase [Armatimonadetes bacterium]|nr:tyrosine-type recombinase/integrase [Armatimonadota bacterium]
MATRRSDGRWMARRNVNGKPVYGYGASEEEADADLESKLIPLIGPLGASPTTLHELAKEVWYPHIEQLAPLTQKRYEGVYTNHIRGRLGNLPLEAITPMAIRRWLNGMVADSDSTKRYVLEILKGILMHAVRMELIGRNPCSAISLPKNYRKRERILDLDAALRLLDGVRQSKLSAPVFLAATMSLRRSEIAGLKWNDLDRRKGELHIVRQRQAVRPYGVIERELKTSESARTLYLSARMIEEIDARGDLDSAYITTFGGRPWVPDTITEFWRAERNGFGLPDWHFHDLRHLAAGLLAAAGCDLLVIAAVLGHRKPDMTLLYTSVSQSRRREGADKMAQLFARKRTFDTRLTLSQSKKEPNGGDDGIRTHDLCSSMLELNDKCRLCTRM